MKIPLKYSVDCVLSQSVCLFFALLTSYLAILAEEV